MKKFVAMLLVLGLSGSVLAGCTTDDTTADDTNPPAGTEEQVDEGSEEVAEGEMTKIGLGHITSIGKSTSADGENGATAEVNSLLAAVGFDAEGKVVNATIDQAQTKVNFDTEGKLINDLAEEIKTKNELKEDYGMKKASGIEKEWYEQAAAFAEWAEGKTVEEITSMELEDGYPAEADLTSSVTVTVTDFIGAIEKAYDNAQDVEAGAETLGLGAEVSIAKSADAEGENGAVAQVDLTINTTAFDADGKVAGAIIDVVQTSVEFDTEGQITTDVDGDFLSKNELKEDYGMKKASGIEKEWYEQAAALADWMTGKTVEEITSMELEDGYPAEADLTSSVTVGVTDYLTVLEEAAETAK